MAKKKTANHRTSKRLAHMMAKKLGVSAVKPEKQNGIVVATVAKPPKKHRPRPTQRERWLIKATQPHASRHRREQQPNNEEKADFQRQQQSMHERHSTVAWKRNATTAKAIQLKPATFTLKKSTTQLIAETVDGVSHLQGIGGGESLATRPLLQRIAAATAAALPPLGAATTGSMGNRFAALEERDEPDSKPRPLFAFAPPTFQLPSSSPTPTPTPAAEEIDPEL